MGQMDNIPKERSDIIPRMEREKKLLDMHNVYYIYPPISVKMTVTYQRGWHTQIRLLLTV